MNRVSFVQKTIDHTKRFPLVDCKAFYKGDSNTLAGYKLTDGRTVTTFEGCLPNEDAARIVKKLTKQLTKGQQIVKVLECQIVVMLGIVDAAR